jgi:hypothetical protein
MNCFRGSAAEDCGMLKTVFLSVAFVNMDPESVHNRPSSSHSVQQLSFCRALVCDS